MTTSETLERERTPEQIEAEIVSTRRSLDRKLHEIEQRLNPRHQWHQLRGTLRERLSSPPVAAWGAVAAVAAGSWMAISGLRRTRPPATELDEETLAAGVVITDVVCE